MVSKESAWLMEQLRFTAFQSPGETFGPSSLWSEVVANEPLEIINKPQEQSLHVKGEWRDGQLNLSVEPLRLDWIFSPMMNKERFEFGVFPSIGDVSVVENFRQLISRWFEFSPPLVRVAFGAILFEPVDDRLSGYRRLSELLTSVKLDPEESRDFLYQINRRRRSKCIDDLWINRLSKWSCVTKRALSIQVHGDEAIAFSSGTTAPSLANRLELDINTVPEYPNQLPKEALDELMAELVNFGTEFWEKGEIA